MPSTSDPSATTVDAPTPEAAAREAVWGYLRDYPDCSITWTESAYIAQLAVEAWKAAQDASHI